MSSMGTAGLAVESELAFDPGAKLSVETVSDYRAFLEMKPVWDRLVDRSAAEHPFLEHDWVRTWWDCFGANGENGLRVVVVMVGQEPIAIAPLIVSTVRMWGFRARRVGFFYNEHVPRADFIVSRRLKGLSQAGCLNVYRLIWDHLLASREWDVLQLCQLREDSETLLEIRKLAQEDGYSSGVWESSASPCVSIQDSWSYYFGELDAKFRSNLRNRLKRLSAIGPLTVETERGGGRLADTLENGFELEAAAWKKDAGTAIACDSHIRNFYETFAARAAGRGWLRLHFLNAGVTRVAFDYSLEYNNRLFLLKSGYDPDHAAYSPTNLLVCRVLEDAFQRGVEHYDFLGDAMDWKLRWTNAVARHYWLFVFSRSFRGKLLYLLKFHLVPLLKWMIQLGRKIAFSSKGLEASPRRATEKS